MPDMTAPRLVAVDGPYCAKHQRIHRFDPDIQREEWRTHTRLHGDEAACMEILKMVAPHTFPADMPIKLVDAGMHLESDKSGWCYLEEGVPCVGVWRGPLDEHEDYDPHNPQAFENINCTHKGARLVGAQDDPGLQEILKYTLRSDRSSFRGPWDIDPIMKAWWRMGLQLEDVMPMYHHIFTAWYHVFSGQRQGPKPKRTFRNAIARWMAERFRPEQKDITVRAGVEQALIKFNLQDCDEFSEFVHLDRRRGGKTWFDLEGVWDALWAARTPEHIINHIIVASLDAKYEAGRQFVLAEYEFHRKARYVESKKHEYSIAVIDSDSDYINRAARSVDPDLDVLIMTLSSGHHRTFNLTKRLNLDSCAARWREAEVLKSAGRHDLSWKYLESKGTIPECLQVYNSHDNLGNFNSTETSPGTPVSAVSTRELVGIYEEGLASAWHRFHVAPARAHNKMVARSREYRREKKAAAALVAPSTE